MGRCAQALARRIYENLEARFLHWRAAGIEVRDELLIDVKADDREALARKDGREGSPQLSKTDDRNTTYLRPHNFPPSPALSSYTLRRRQNAMRMVISGRVQADVGGVSAPDDGAPGHECRIEELPYL
jgi:hypothetical protein